MATLGPEAVFAEALDWLRNAYGDFHFFEERDVVWTLQEHLRSILEQQRLPYSVFNEFPMLPGTRRAKSADLALVSSQGSALLTADFKYEPDHLRAGPEIWPGKFPRVAWTGDSSVLEDVRRASDYVARGRTPVAFSVLVDEGGAFSHREAPAGTVWQTWACGGARPRTVHALLGAFRR